MRGAAILRGAEKGGGAVDERDPSTEQRRRVDALMKHLFAGRANRWAAERQQRIEQLARREEEVEVKKLRRKLDEFRG